MRTPPGNAARLSAASPRYAEVAADGSVTDFAGATIPSRPAITGLTQPIVAATEADFSASEHPGISPALLAADVYFMVTAAGTVYNDTGSTVWTASITFPEPLAPGSPQPASGMPPTAPIVAAGGLGDTTGTEVNGTLVVTGFIPGQRHARRDRIHPGTRCRRRI